MWYIVLSRSRPGKDSEKERNYEAHRQWLEDQHRAGRLLFSGPTTDGEYGIYVMLASSLDEAKRSLPRTRIMSRASAKWRCGNGAPIARFA